MAITNFCKTVLTGGTASALDGIDGATLLDGDRAFVAVAGVLHYYVLDDDLGGAESSPEIIAPDTNPGNKRWRLQGFYPSNHLLFSPDATYDIGAAGATRPRDIHCSRDLVAGDQLFERGRTTAVGEWTTPAFDAGNFTAGGTQTWTVAEADVITFAYTMIGLTMKFSFSVDTTTVGGTPHTDLYITIPGGFTAAKAMVNGLQVRNNNVYGSGTVAAAAGLTKLTLYCAMNGTTNWTAATNTTGVYGQIEFEVQ